MNDLAALSILYVEDEPELRDHVTYALKLHINTVATATNGKEALESVRLRRPDVVISDIRMPIMDGLELTAALRHEFPDLPVIICTAFTDTDYLLKAIELGVAAYVPKPIDTFRLLTNIKQAALPVLQHLEIARLKSEIIQARGLLIGTSHAMSKLGEQIAHVAASDYSVVVRGEAATGKNAIAELLYGMSKRKGKAFFTIDCRNRSSEQLEAELFGTAAGRGRPAVDRAGGVLRELDGGTIVFDAPELLSLPLQGRILHLLEEHSYIPTGAIEPFFCNVRAIAITTTDLEKESQAGRFRRELWLRLSDAVLTVPPLRERKDDLPRFCRAFLAQAAADLGRQLMAVPGPVTSAQSVGCHVLLRDRNALCVTTAGEVLDAVGAAGEHLLSPVRAPDHPRDALPETVRRVLDAVPVRSPAGEASIARTAGVSALVVQQVLPPLLVAGLVERRDGGWRLTALGAGRPAAVPGR